MRTNYITTLRRQLGEARTALAAKDSMLEAFMIHLDLGKFHGEGPNGERKDWIATEDVRRRLRDIMAVTGEQDT